MEKLPCGTYNLGREFQGGGTAKDGSHMEFEIQNFPFLIEDLNLKSNLKKEEERVSSNLEARKSKKERRKEGGTFLHNYFRFPQDNKLKMLITFKPTIGSDNHLTAGNLFSSKYS